MAEAAEAAARARRQYVQAASAPLGVSATLTVTDPAGASILNTTSARAVPRPGQVVAAEGLTVHETTCSPGCRKRPCVSASVWAASQSAAATPSHCGAAMPNTPQPPSATPTAKTTTATCTLAL